MCVDSTGWDNYKTGIFVKARPNPKCDHSVVIIGYGPGYWLIRNFGARILVWMGTLKYMTVFTREEFLRNLFIAQLFDVSQEFC